MVTERGRALLSSLHIDAAAPLPAVRASTGASAVRTASVLGTALLDRSLANDWAERVEDSRGVHITA